MSNVKGRPNPFDNPVAKRPQTVGKTYGRRRQLAAQHAQTAPSARPKRKPADVFNKAGRGQDKIAAFSPRATFKKGLRRFSGIGAPYKRALHDRVEGGTATRSEGAPTPPSDKAIINFLDRVIATPTLASRQAILKSMQKR